MISEARENEYNVYINNVNNNNNDSIDDNDIQISGKYLTFNSNTNHFGMFNTKVNIAKKNTKISSNIDEDLDFYNNNDINENKSDNNLDDNIPFQDSSPKKSRNDNNEEKLNYLNSVISFSNNNVITACENYNNNVIKKMNLSENKNIKNEDALNILVTGRSLNSIDRQTNKKLKPITLNKNKKKKKNLLLEEKSKYKTSKNMNNAEEKEEKKEEEKILRKDRNGVPICRKNRRKVKITFHIPFENVTPIESYKQYNVLLGMPKDENFMNDKFGECHCCSLV